MPARCCASSLSTAGLLTEILSRSWCAGSAVQGLSVLSSKRCLKAFPQQQSLSLHCLPRSGTLGGPGSVEDGVAVSARMVPLRLFMGVPILPPTKPRGEISISTSNLKIPSEQFWLLRHISAVSAGKLAGSLVRAESIFFHSLKHSCLSSVSPPL